MFNWLTNWFKGKEQRSLENPAVPLWTPTAYDYLVGRRSSAGVPVNRQSVLGITPLWRGVNLISQKVARLPLNVYKKNKDGGREIDVEHPAQWLLACRPSALYTPFSFKQTMVYHALLHGNAYAYIFRQEFGEPEELLILNPDYTFPALDNGKLWYVTRMNNTDRKLLPENVFHLKGLSDDGIVGHSVIDVLREALGLTMAQQRYASTFFRNDGSPGPLILKTPNFLKDDEYRKQFREQWSKIHEGLDNKHRVAILENGLEPVVNEIDHEKQQFIESRQFSIIDIANVVGVPPHKLGANVTTSYGSLESEERAFLNDTLDGWLTAIEEEAELKLLTTRQVTSASRFIEFDRRSLEQADYKTRSESLIGEVNNGIRTENEARALLNLPSVGSDGDRLRMPSNITFIDLVGPKDDPATDEPEPMVETSPATGDTDEKEPVNTDPNGAGIGVDAPDSNRFKALLKSVVERACKRIRKAMEARKHAEPSQVLAEHQSVVIESLEPATDHAAAFVDEWFKGLAEECRAVLPEQLDSVLDRIDANAITERLMKHGNEN